MKNTKNIFLHIKFRKLNKDNCKYSQIRTINSNYFFKMKEGETCYQKKIEI